MYTNVYLRALESCANRSGRSAFNWVRRLLSCCELHKSVNCKLCEFLLDPVITDICSGRNLSDFESIYLLCNVRSPLRRAMNHPFRHVFTWASPCCDQIRSLTVWFEVLEYTLSLSAIHKVELSQLLGCPRMGQPQDIMICLSECVEDLTSEDARRPCCWNETIIVFVNIKRCVLTSYYDSHRGL